MRPHLLITTAAAAIAVVATPASADTLRARLRELVPDARVAVAHGKMNEHQLEAVIDSFWRKETDVLVCTTIVETGLDVSGVKVIGKLDRQSVV